MVITKPLVPLYGAVAVVWRPHIYPENRKSSVVLFSQHKKRSAAAKLVMGHTSNIGSYIGIISGPLLAT